MGDRDRDAAFRGAIELGQHDPVHAGDVHELARLRHAVLADRRVEHQQHFVRRARHLARGDPFDLLQLVHQVDAGMEPPGGIDENRVAALRLAGRDRVEDDRRWIRTVARAHDVDIGAVGPDLELLDRGGAKGVGGANQRPLPLVPQQVGELPDGRRLAGPVHADDQGHLRPRRDRDRLIDGSKDTQDFLLHEIAEAGAVARLDLNRGDDPVGGRDAEVGRDEQLFERVDGLDVHGTGTLLGRVGGPDDLVEAINDLFGGAREPLADAAEESHPRDLIRSLPPPAVCAASARRWQYARRSGRSAPRPSAS